MADTATYTPQDPPMDPGDGSDFIYKSKSLRTPPTLYKSNSNKNTPLLHKNTSMNVDKGSIFTRVILPSKYNDKEDTQQSSDTRTTNETISDQKLQDFLLDKPAPVNISEWATVGHYPSPILGGSTSFARTLHPDIDFASAEESVVANLQLCAGDSDTPIYTKEFMRAGPMRHTAFHPKTVKAAILTCGGLCPGMNTVIREIFITLHDIYQVDNIYGIKYGFHGFTDPELSMRKLQFSDVANIHYRGGSVLGTSRESFDTMAVIESIIEHKFTHVYIVGGRGSMYACQKLADEVRNRKLKIAIVSIPGSIQNDIPLIDKAFGFDTGIRNAVKAIASAKVEAQSAINGIGLVKLPGDQSGSISLFAALSCQNVDFCLIPEVPFELGGPKGLYQAVLDRLKENGHCVITVSEGAGLNMFDIEKAERDAQGKALYPDIGEYLKKSLNKIFEENGVVTNLKYIDSVQMIRTSPPTAADNLTTSLLAQSSVHSAFNGLSGVFVGLVNSHNVVIPLQESTSANDRQVDTHGRMWERLLDITGQPSFGIQ